MRRVALAPWDNLRAGTLYDTPNRLRSPKDVTFTSSQRSVIRGASSPFFPPGHKSALPAPRADACGRSQQGEIFPTRSRGPQFPGYQRCFVGPVFDLVPRPEEGAWWERNLFLITRVLLCFFTRTLSLLVSTVGGCMICFKETAEIGKS